MAGIQHRGIIHKMRKDLSKPILALALLAQGCHPEAPPPATATMPPPPPPPESPPLPAPATPAPRPPQRGPSSVMLSHWPATASPFFVAYADMRGLARSPLGATLLPDVFAGLQHLLPAMELACVHEVLDSAEELLFRIDANQDDALAVLRYDEAAKPPTACFASWFGGTPAPMDGLSEAYRAGRVRLAFMPGLVVFGSETNVRDAVPARAQTFPSELALAQGEYIHVVIPSGDLTGGLIASPEHFWIGFDGDSGKPPARDLPPGDFAPMVRQMVPSLLRLPPEDAPVLDGLLRSLRVTRAGERVAVSLDLRGSVDEQARTLRAAATVVKKAAFAARNASAAPASQPAPAGATRPLKAAPKRVAAPASEQGVCRRFCLPGEERDAYGCCGPAR